jgi:hypothetical protein
MGMQVGITVSQDAIIYTVGVSYFQQGIPDQSHIAQIFGSLQTV